MIENNYSQINYIRDDGTPIRYDFIPHDSKPPLKDPKKTRKGTFFLLLLTVFLIGGMVYKFDYVSAHFVAVKDNLLNVPNRHITNAQLTDTGPQGSDDVASTTVIEDSQKSPVKHYSLTNTSLLPAVGADSFLIGDVETGEVIVEKNGTKQYPIASVSKLMTALVARKNLNMHEKTIVSKEALTAYGTTGELTAGDKIRLTDLMYPLLIESSNDAAEVFAEVLPTGVFIELMNKQAKELGMDNTSYQDPSGLTPYNISTVKDLFKLASHIYKNEKEILDITRVKEYSILNHKWVNHSHFLGYNNFIGGKNGYTDEARRTSVTFFSIPVNEDENRVLSLIVLKTENREKDIGTLFDYIKKNVIYTE